ncbi:MAG: MbtH family protein [Azospirillaceae bacterium]|nr:MbtH family protein [Azospirillaceae bacterium]
MPNDDDDAALYLVVVNDEEQYSIWPTGRDLPSGWRGVTGPAIKADCLAHISRVWVDMRPASLRRPVGGGTDAAGTMPNG